MEYKIIEEKGQGGYGIVYHVHDQSNKSYALKKFLINQGSVPTPDEEKHFKGRFVREVLTQKGIISKNIVQIINHDFDVNPMYYIMPLAICTLKDELDLGSLTDAQKINIIYDILNGLDAIHDLGLCHRDLKPSNVLKFYDEVDNHHYYAISDFGLISKSNNSSTSLTLTGTQKSDDHYTALELHIDFKKGTLKSDIYSVGCIIHDLFFPNDPRPPMREINVSNITWKNILSRCTKDFINERYDSIDELRNDIFNLNLNDNEESNEVIDHFEFLDSTKLNSIDTKSWDLLLDQLEKDDELSNVLHLKINTNHILHLINISYNKIDIFAEVHSKWISHRSFDFNYCDILAYKLKLLYEATPITQSNIGSKSQCLLALLYLGTSHNRFYVEKMFSRYVIDDDLNDKLAKRLALEFNLNKMKIYDAIEHLKYSISFNKNNLHPILLEAYDNL